MQNNTFYRNPTDGSVVNKSRSNMFLTANPEQKCVESLLLLFSVWLSVWLYWLAECYI